MLGAILAVIFVESMFARHDLDLSRPENMGWRWGRSAARREAPKADILGFGTSMMQAGFLPREIAARTGRPTYSMAVVSSQMPYSYYIFKHAIDSGAKPSAVIIDFPVNFLGTALDSQSASWPDALSVADTLDMAWNLGDARFFAAVLSEKWLPSLAYRLQIRKAVLAALRGESASLRADNLAYTRNHNRNLGATVTGKNASYNGEITPFYRDVFLSDHWRADPIKARYFRRLIKLAAANDAKVYWLITPFAPELQAGRDEKNLDALYNEFARVMTSNFPNLTVLDARHSGYGVKTFRDAIHLDIDGASALSHAVADVLNDDAQSSSWVRLPQFRARPIDAPVELLSESINAVRSGMGLRR